MATSHIEQGGYAKVIVHEDRRTVEKHLRRYYQDAGRTYTDASSIQDIAISRTLSGLPGFPVFVSHHRSGKKDEVLTLAHHGRNLHELAHDMRKGAWSQAAINRELCSVLVQVTRACMAMLDNGLLHTDLKPANVLVSDAVGSRQHTTLIDFNMVSAKVAGCDTEWTASMGTWSFASPEIVVADMPCPASMVWSIGIMMAWVVNRIHPLVAKLGRYDIGNMAQREEWTELFSKGLEAYPAGVPLTSVLSNRMTPEMADIFVECCRWRPEERIGLQELHDALVATLRDDAPKPQSWRVVHHLHNPSCIDGWVRHNLLETMFDVLSKHSMPYLFVRAATLFDRCCMVGETDLALDKVALGCVLFAGHLLGSFMLEEDEFQADLLEAFGAWDRVTVLDLPWKIGQMLHWKAWEKVADVWDEDATSLEFHVWKEVLTGRTAPYSQQDLVRAAKEYEAERARRVVGKEQSSCFHKKATV